jgi:hypothetical protein
MLFALVGGDIFVDGLVGFARDRPCHKFGQKPKSQDKREEKSKSSSDREVAKNIEIEKVIKIIEHGALSFEY